MRAAPTKAPAAPTQEQLALAYRQLQRPHWPATLQAALKHPTYGICVTGLARQLGRRTPAESAMRSPRKQATAALAVPPVVLPPAKTQPTPVNRRWPQRSRAPTMKPTGPACQPQPRTVDRKRAAANDLDELEPA